MKLDANAVKMAAAGRWIEIHRSVCGLTEEQLDPKRHGRCPGPNCGGGGGTDRFRAMNDVAETGALYCNQCFSTRNGDGFAAIQWLRNVPFSTAVKLVAQAIGFDPSTDPAISGDSSSMPPKNVPKAQKPKKVYATADNAIDAIAYSLHRSGVLESQRPPDFSWPYYDKDGNEVGVVVRWDISGSTKEIRQVSRVGDGSDSSGWVNAAMPELRPLYRLPELAEASEVWVCEGEKAVDAAVGLGLCATTSLGGANAVHKSDWSPLNGKRVCILPDNDGAGEKFANTVAHILRRNSPDTRISVVQLRDDWGEIPEKGDIYDWREHNSFCDPQILRDRLQALARRGDDYAVSLSHGTTESAASQVPELKFAGKSVLELWALADELIEWIVENILSADQPTIFGAKQKSLKTTLLADLAVSLASQLPWLGRFKIPRRRRVLFVTGESSRKAAMRKIKRAMTVRNLRPEDIEGYLRIEAVDFPNLPNLEDCTAIQNVVKKYEIEVVILDPLYMGLQGVNTANLTEVGPAMRKFTEHCRPANAIFAHHVKKSASYESAPNLEDLSQTGIAEFAGNYWLIGKLEEYKGGGLHKLAIRYGGRDEQYGLLKLEFDEKKWEAKITDLADYQTDQKARKETEAVVALYEKIRRHLQRYPEGRTESALASGVGTKKDRQAFTLALADLEKRGVIVCIPNFLAGNRQKCIGWKLAPQHDGGQSSPVTVLDVSGSNVDTTDAAL